MCLMRVTSNIPKPNARGFGWKLVGKTGRDYKPLFGRTFVNINGRTATNIVCGKFRVGKRATALMENISGDDGTKYSSGFHFFTKKEDAERYGGGPEVRERIVRVRWSHELARGFDGDYETPMPCIVAKHITILPAKKIKKKG